MSTGPDRGAAVQELAWSAGRAGSLRGEVLSVHRRAVYLRFGDALVAQVGPGVDAGPLHLRGGPLPPARPGQPIRLDGVRIAARTWAVRCDLPDRIQPLPDPADLLAAQAHCERVDPELPVEMPVRAAEVAAAVRAGDLVAAARLLGGRGPGLTPAGDDVLAGLVLVAYALHGPAAGPALQDVVGRVRTTEYSAAFLHWAARGQGLEPAHDWLTATAADRDPHPAEHRLARVGASSGRCLIAGLRLGLAQLPAEIQSISPWRVQGLWHRTE